MTDLRFRRSPSLAAVAVLLLIAASACTAPAASQTASQSAAASPTSAASSGSSGGPSASAGGSASGAATITINGSSSFGADEITVTAGEDVTIVNNSSSSHTFTEGENGAEADEPVVNEQIPAGAQAVVQFDEPGDYHVTCLFHSVMNMEVHVE